MCDVCGMYICATRCVKAGVVLAKVGCSVSALMCAIAWGVWFMDGFDKRSTIIYLLGHGKRVKVSLGETVGTNIDVSPNMWQCLVECRADISAGVRWDMAALHFTNL